LADPRLFPSTDDIALIPQRITTISEIQDSQMMPPPNPKPCPSKMTITSRYSSVRRSRNALPMTDTELKLIAAAAIIGDSSKPKNGYNTPAATGTPSEL
jgi:hypothetical protein